MSIMKSFQQTNSFASDADTEEKNEPNRFKRGHLWVYAILFGLFLFLSFTAQNNPVLPRFHLGDNDVFRYCGSVVANGGIPYSNSFDHKGPILFLFNAIGYIIGGHTGIWILQLFFLSISLTYAYKLLRCFVNPIISLISIFIVFMISPIGDNSVECFALPFILISLYYFYLYVHQDGVLRWYQIVNSGCGFAAVFLLRPNMVGLWIFFCLYVLCFCLYKRFYRRLVTQIMYFISGVGIVTLPTCVYLLTNNAWDDFVYQYFIFNLLYTFCSDAPYQHYDNFKHYVLCVYQMIAVIGSYLLLFFITILSERKRPFFFISSLTYIFCIWAARSYSGRYFIPVTPFLLVSLSVILNYIFYSAHNKWTSYYQLNRCLVYLSSIVLIMFLPLMLVGIKNRTSSIDNEYPVEQWIKDNIPSEAKIMNYGRMSRILLDTDRISGTKYSYFPRSFNNMPERIVSEYTREINGHFDYMIVFKQIVYRFDDQDMFHSFVLPVLERKNSQIVYEDDSYVIYKTHE